MDLAKDPGTRANLEIHLASSIQRLALESVAVVSESSFIRLDQNIRGG